MWLLLRVAGAFVQKECRTSVPPGGKQDASLTHCLWADEFEGQEGGGRWSRWKGQRWQRFKGAVQYLIPWFSIFGCKLQGGGQKRQRMRRSCSRVIIQHSRGEPLKDPEQKKKKDPEQGKNMKIIVIPSSVINIYAYHVLSTVLSNSVKPYNNFRQWIFISFYIRGNKFRENKQLVYNQYLLRSS